MTGDEIRGQPATLPTMESIMEANNAVLTVPVVPVSVPCLEVLTEHPGPPDWVIRWCERHNTRLRVHHIAHSSPPWPSTALLRQLEHVRGRMVLIDRRTTPRHGQPTVVAAVQSLPDDKRLLTAAAQSAWELNARLIITHAVPLAFGERSIGLAEALERGRGMLDHAVAQIAADLPDLQVTHRLHRTRPHELVDHFADADLLVIGRPHSRAGAGHGLVTRAALTDGTGPLLLVPHRSDQPPPPASSSSATSSGCGARQRPAPSPT